MYIDHCISLQFSSVATASTNKRSIWYAVSTTTELEKWVKRHYRDENGERTIYYSVRQDNSVWMLGSESAASGTFRSLVQWDKKLLPYSACYETWVAPILGFMKIHSLGLKIVIPMSVLSGHWTSPSGTNSCPLSTQMEMRQGHKTKL